METVDQMNDSAYHVFEDVGRRINVVSGDNEEVLCQSAYSVSKRLFFLRLSLGTTN